MDKIYSLLERHRLQSYYGQFQQLGVRDERDFLDGVTDEDLTNLGLTHVEKNRFKQLQRFIRRLSAPVSLESSSAQSSMTMAFSLKYTFPMCSEPRSITDMDPSQNTVEDLMLRIGHAENIGSSKGVCLYTMDGMPLTDDPFFNTWSLQDRHICHGDLLYAIFSPKENLLTLHRSEMNPAPVLGTETVRCHVMLKGHFEVKVDLDFDTVVDVKNKLSGISGIPAYVLHYRLPVSAGSGRENVLYSHYRDTADSGRTLKELGITKETILHFSLSSFPEDFQNSCKLFFDDIVPSVQQTKKGISVFLASLYVIKNRSPVVGYVDMVGFIRKVTGCNPLAQSLCQLLQKNQLVSRTQKIAIFEGLYTLFREILPKLGSSEGSRIIEDQEVFEHSLFCWSYIISETKEEDSLDENYAPVSLCSDSGQRFCEPVLVPGVPGTMERAAVLQKIRDGETIPFCSEKVLQPTSLKKCIYTEKILLSVHPIIRTYYLCISHSSVSGKNFRLETMKSLEVMSEEMKAFPLLTVTPPLLLKDLGQRVCLVYLNQDNLGVYNERSKMHPGVLHVYDCLAGQTLDVDVDVLAAQTGDHRNDQTVITSRIPKEAILVLIDTSSSMTEKCYGSVDIEKIHAVKELFHSFANRSMAYDFHHIVGLVKFDSLVKTLQPFTETLETFKDSVETLEASGCTVLYDALHHGRRELEKVQSKFPNCILRILCLTDGNDSGSAREPADVAKSLIKSGIIVDSVLLGDVENNVLHGISIVSGGCCFKPNTSKDGLKLFETETVLSAGIRKPKNKVDPASVTETFLRRLFTVHGYDDFPEAALPSAMTNKVTVTEDVLKKKIRESKDSRFLEKDRRILEELKDLHCQPHPFFQIFPSETDFTFWKLLMEGPPDTPYESGVFELFCQFGPEYPVKPPTVRFITSIYHCNINNVGRICHNIFDRGYNAHVTMREILNAVYGLLIAPEPQDPLDSILAEEYLSEPHKYNEEAKKQTEKSAGQSLRELEMKLVDTVKSLPQKLICPLTKKIYVDPVITKYQDVYERKAIEKHLKTLPIDPFAFPPKPLTVSDCKPCLQMKVMVMQYRASNLKN